MTDPERQQAVLAVVAAQLEDRRAEQAIDLILSSKSMVILLGLDVVEIMRVTLVSCEP